jgi:hypothetical protein
MGSLLVLAIQPLKRNLIVEMHIEQNIAMQEIKWCGAANPKTHNRDKE